LFLSPMCADSARLAPLPHHLSTPSLHDALPICIRSATNKGFFDWFGEQDADILCVQETKAQEHQLSGEEFRPRGYHVAFRDATRSEEHTSELQSRENLVCRLLLEKKKAK